MQHTFLKLKPIPKVRPRALTVFIGAVRGTLRARTCVQPLVIATTLVPVTPT